MKFLNCYKDICGCNNSKEVFDYFLSSLTSTNHTWKYFVDWEKIKKNIERYNIELNILNSICTATKPIEELDKILTKYPEVTKCFPSLLAIRDDSVKIFSLKDNGDFVFEDYIFNNQESKYNKELCKKFLIDSGIFEFVSNGMLTNIKDYIFGVEVGLDTNARKNRSGKLNQEIVEILIKDTCDKLNFKLIKEANKTKIDSEFGVDMPLDKSSRRFDFALYNNSKDRLVVIETNFYSSEGSKLKSTCGEYKVLQNFLKKHKIEFIWITDGEGWTTTHIPLKEVFDNNDYIVNLSMVKKGIFKSILENIKN